MNYNSIKGVEEALSNHSFRASLRSGFTLIELLVVVLIIGILSAVALPQYQTAVERSRATEALTQMSAVSDALQRYHSQHEAWTTSFNKLDVDIPTYTENATTYHGGKYFTLEITNNSDGKAVVKATRRREEGKGKYALSTEISVNTNGTYGTTRKCAASSNTDEDAVSYCNAITGGGDNNNNF